MMQTTDRRRLTSVAPPAGAWRQVSGLVIMVCMSLLLAASDGAAGQPNPYKDFTLPFYPGSQVVRSHKGSRGWSADLVSSDGVKPIFDFYKKYLQSIGWRLHDVEDPSGVRQGYFGPYEQAQLMADGPEIRHLQNPQALVRIARKRSVTEIHMTVDSGSY